MATTETKRLIDDLGSAFEEFRDRQDARIDDLQSELAAERKARESHEEYAATGGKARTNRQQEAERKAFDRFLRTGDKAGLEAVETKELNMGTAAAGGALIPEQIANQIISRAISRSRLVQVVRQAGPYTSDYVRLVNLRGATASWSSETGTRSETDTPTFREVRPTHGELYSYPTFTRWAAEDSQFNVQDFLVENVSDQFSKSLENAILLGSGTNRPTGILNTSSVTTDDGASPERNADTIEYITDGNSPTDLSSAIIDLYFHVKPEYRANGVFVMSSATLAAVRKLRDSNGSGFLWQANLAQGVDAPDGMLLNRPVVLSEYAPGMNLSPLSDAILFGDFTAGYELVRIGRMGLIRDEVTTPGKIKLYIFQRWGGRLTDNDAIKSLHV